MPLTKRLDCAVLYRLASSSASLMATFTGTSGRWSISKAPRRRMFRSIAAMPLQRPVLGHLADQAVDLRLVLADPADQRIGVGPQLRVAEAALDEPADLVGGDVRVLLELVEDLEGDLATAGASGHGRPACRFGSGRVSIAVGVGPFGGLRPPLVLRIRS